MRIFTRLLAASAGAALLAACGGGETSTSETAPVDYADMLIHGGVIYTGVDEAPTVEALTVKDGRIAGVGAYAGL